VSEAVLDHCCGRSAFSDARPVELPEAGWRKALDPSVVDCFRAYREALIEWRHHFSGEGNEAPPLGPADLC
jgi:hypothetical protein